jgi:hypothetical protein
MTTRFDETRSGITYFCRPDLVGRQPYQAVATVKPSLRQGSFVSLLSPPKKNRIFPGQLVSLINRVPERPAAPQGLLKFKHRSNHALTNLRHKLKIQSL